MPSISFFFGITVWMYFFDNEQHHKPHIHAKYGEFEASYSLDGELLEGSLPRKQHRIVLGWLEIREDELRINWDRAVRGEAIDKIEPLK